MYTEEAVAVVTIFKTLISDHHEVCIPLPGGCSLMLPDAIHMTSFSVTMVTSNHSYQEWYASLEIYTTKEDVCAHFVHYYMKHWVLGRQ